MPAIQLFEPTLTDEIYQVAREEGKDAVDILEDAVRQYLALYRQKRIRADTESWYQLPVEVRNKYSGQFVAVYNGEIVDSDPDRIILNQRVRQRFVRQPVVLVEGGDQPMPTYRIYSARQP